MTCSFFDKGSCSSAQPRLGLYAQRACRLKRNRSSGGHSVACGRSSFKSSLLANGKEERGPKSAQKRFSREPFCCQLSLRLFCGSGTRVHSVATVRALPTFTNAIPLPNRALRCYHSLVAARESVTFKRARLSKRAKRLSRDFLLKVKRVATLLRV